MKSSRRVDSVNVYRELDTLSDASVSRPYVCRRAAQHCLTPIVPQQIGIGLRTPAWFWINANNRAERVSDPCGSWGLML